MTDRAGKPGGGGVSDNAFSGPTAAQTGSSNTQINHYAAPSTRTGKVGCGAQLAMMTAAVLLGAGAVVFVVLNLVPGWGGEPQGEPDGKPTQSPPAPQQGNITPAGDVRRCVDVRHNRDVNAIVQTWKCNHVQGQRWRWEGSMLRAFTRCLGVQYLHTENGAPVSLMRCTGRGNQEWEWADGEKGRPGHGKLRNPNSGRCLGYPENPEGKKFVQLRIYDCDSASTRVWTHH